MKKALLLGVVLGICIITGFLWKTKLLSRLLSRSAVTLNLPLTKTPKQLPLLRYTIPHLREYPYQASTIVVEKKIAEFPTYTSYLFSYTTLGKKMTGQLNIPKETQESFPVIILVRGFVPAENYQTGTGTKSAAALFAQHGYVTLAPDFFGYGGSDPETTDSWEARFQKPVSVVELFKTIAAQPNIHVTTDEEQFSFQMNSNKVGMWAHSNGGQIALTALEIADLEIPTTLWAPVTTPFPYSVLYFSDEDIDEGKAARALVADFEKDYNVQQFSFTDFFKFLHSPLQLHQGMSDEAIHYIWSSEFVDKIKKENLLRKNEAKAQSKQSTSSASASPTKEPLPYMELIPITFYSYPNTDHNMKPSWNEAIERDIAFFTKYVESAP